MVSLLTGRHSKAADAAKQILNEKGIIFIYAHGSKKGYVSTGSDDIMPKHILKAFNEAGEKHAIDYIWALSCHFGSGGGAKAWVDILDTQKGIDGHIGTADLNGKVYVKQTLLGALRLGGDYGVDAMRNDFEQLLEDLNEGKSDYDKFIENWQATYDKWNKRGCIKYAFWHSWDANYKYKNYTKKTKP